MNIAYHKVGYERLKLSNDGLNDFLLVVMPRISPSTIIQQVLGPFETKFIVNPTMCS